MKIYPVEDDQGRLHAFEVDHLRLSRAKAAKIVKAIPNVSITREPKRFLSWFREDVFCEFSIDGAVFQVDEPFGDSARYWIGKKGGGGWCEELELVKRAFQSS